jgi:hypothetical protein
MPQRKIARSAGTGRFVKKSYAKTHPKTTEIEKVPLRRRRRKKKGGGHTGFGAQG